MPETPSVADVAVGAISIANPIVGAGLQILRSLWPELKPLFTSSGSEVAQRNAKAAEAILATVVQATGAANVQGAVDAIQADPDLAKKARGAAFDVLADYGLVEIAGGIAEARKVAAAQDRPVVGRLTFVQFLSLLMLCMTAMGGAWVLWDPMGHFGDQIRAMVITAMIIGGWSGVQAFHLGSSSASRNKDATIAAQAEQR